MAGSEEELKNLLMNVKEESEKDDLKLNIQKADHGIWFQHSMANRWGNNGNSEKLYFGGLQYHCSCEIKKILSPWKKSYDQPKQHIKMQRHYLRTRVRLVKAMFFSQ